MKIATNKGRVILGIALAAIIFASIFGALAPTSARDGTGAIERGDVVYRGERGLDVSAIVASVGAFYGMAGTTADGALITVADNTSFSVPSTAKVGPYNITSREGTVADMIVETPEITADVFLEGTTDSIVGMSIPQGTIITVRATPNFGGIMKDVATGDDVKIKIKFTKPNGITETYVVLACSPEFDICFATDETWSTGTWKVKITTDKATCNDVEVSSDEVEFTIRSPILIIDAEKDEVGKGDDMIIQVTGDPSEYYYLAIEDVKTGEEPEIKASDDVKALGTGEGGAGAKTAAWIKTGSDGIADIAIGTTDADERTYTIKIWEVVAGKVPQPYDFVAPDAVTHDGLDDDVQVTVVPATVTFEVPTTAILGEEVEINGAISAGNQVDIIIRDEEIVATDEVVDWNNEFSVDWDTSGHTVGSYAIEAYIDFRPGVGKELDDYDGVDPDGSTTILLITPGVDATQPRNVVAEGDDYTFEGTATGVNSVDYILVGPKGWKSGHDANIIGGILKGTTSVTANEFSEDETMTDGLDTDVWVTVVLSPGRDGVYQTGESAGALTLAALGVTEGKTQVQILELIEDKITEAGSDDLFVALTFEVETPYVSFDPIENVPIGTPLDVTGTTNRETGTMIVIYAIEGPVYLPPAIAEVEWPTADVGVFNATIDTTDAVAGNYTLEADDGDGNADTATVEILAQFSIFDTEKSENPYPSICGTHNGTITPSCNINVSRLYTYPCVGTGGHTEFIKLFENDALIANGTWNGYKDDWHNVTITPSVTLQAGHTYNYTIVMGSYPQIIHETPFNATGGTITCTSFEDANGKVHYDWIPAIRLE